MKDVENLFKRLGTKAEYQEYGGKLVQDVRQRWPLVDDVTKAEANRLALREVKAPDPSTFQLAQIDRAQPEDRATPAGVAKAVTISPAKLPVKASVTKRPTADLTVRQFFKASGGAPNNSADALAEPRQLFTWRKSKSEGIKK